MNKFCFVILLLFAFTFLTVQGKKEEKNAAAKSTAISKANTNILEIIQLFKSLFNQALSKADFTSVRGMLSSPLSIGATAISVLLGGIVLMAFYESPLSPLPVPPLPQAPVGRFPPLDSAPGALGGGAGPAGHHGPMQRQSSGASNFNDYMTPEHQLVLNNLRMQMLHQPQSQYFYQKSPANSPPSPSIKRSSNSDSFSYLNQMRNNLMPTYTFDQDLTAQPSVNQIKKEAPHSRNANSNDNLNAAASTSHVSFASHLPAQTTNNNKNFNTLDKPNVQPSNMQNSPLNVQQNPDPVYVPVDDKRSFEKISLDHHVIKEEDFDQKQLVHSQLSSQFESSPELVRRLEQDLKRSAE